MGILAPHQRKMDRQSREPAKEPVDRLDSWKEIAAYLRRDVRTVQRWERQGGLPVYRVGSGKRAPVFAYASEIDEWLSGSADGNDLEAEVKTAAGSWKYLKLAALLAACIALVLILLQSRPGKHRNGPPKPPFKISNLTSSLQRDFWPSFSPDGESVVFAREVNERNYDILIQDLGGTEARPIANHDSSELYPVWSPNGREIFFLRLGPPEAGVFSVTVEGGNPRELVKLKGRPSLEWRIWDPLGIDCSPDARYLAFSDRESPDQPWAVFLFSFETGEVRQLSSPEKGSFGDHYPRFSPDGGTVAFLRGPQHLASDLFLIPVQGGDAVQLTREEANIFGHAWTADGTGLVYSSNRTGQPTLWRVNLADLKPEPLSGIGQGAVFPALSRDGSAVTFTELRRDYDIWRMEISDRGDILTKVIDSTQGDHNVQLSPDGTRVAFTSTRTGDYQIWTAKADGSKPKQLTSLRVQMVGSPRWSPDGSWIAFDAWKDGRANIHLVTPEGDRLVQFTDDPSSDVLPSWAHDGGSIYFASNRSGDFEIWNKPVGGGEIRRLTDGGGFEAFEMDEGHALLFARLGEAGLWELDLASGATRLVVNGVVWGRWAIANEGVYFLDLDAAPGAVFRCADFSTWEIRTVAKAPATLRNLTSGPMMDVSGDGRLIYFEDGFQISNLVIVENF